MAERVYRIPGAQVRCLDPLVVRYRCSPDVHLFLGEEDVGSYLDRGVVHLVIDAKVGVPEVPPDLPQDQDDYFPDFTELVFLGAVNAQVDGNDLVVVSRGDIYLTAGADHLPVAEAMLNEAGSLGWAAISVDDVPPHKP